MQATACTQKMRQVNGFPKCDSTIDFASKLSSPLSRFCPRRAIFVIDECNKFDYRTLILMKFRSIAQFMAKFVCLLVTMGARKIEEVGDGITNLYVCMYISVQW